MSTDFFEDLTARGLVYQTSSPALREALSAGKMTAYVGFDPTAASLHVGSLLPVMMLMRFQRAGHRPIAIIGGGTGLIGDPSGKQAERTMLTPEKLAENLAGLRGQLERFLDFTDGRALLIDNADWLGKLPLIDFLRDVGKHFSVNAMIVRDSVKMRLEQREQGISYTEFSYMLLQAYDFLHLFDRHGCALQMGGSDQWGNILSGIDLVRRLRGQEAFALTWPLMTRSDGQKFGKSEAGNVWLDANLTSPYEFFQFWRNTDDRDVIGYLKYFTLRSVEEIAAIDQEHAGAPEKRAAQQVLADEVTRLVHGADALARVQRTSAVLFGTGSFTQLSAQELDEAFRSAPSTPLPADALGTPAASLIEVLAAAGVCPSKGRARQDVTGGAVSINNVKVRDAAHVIGVDDVLPGGFVVLGKGKRNYHVLRVAGAAR